MRWRVLPFTFGPVGNDRSSFTKATISPPSLHFFAVKDSVTENIVHHVLDVGGRSETTEEPPGCKCSTLPVSVACKTVTLKALRRTRCGPERVGYKPYLNDLMCYNLLYIFNLYNRFFYQFIQRLGSLKSTRQFF